MIQLTPVVKNLIIVNVLVFIAIQISPPQFGHTLALQSKIHGNFQPYQLVTAMFTHYNLSHIFFNMFSLVFFGPLIERRIGEKRMLVAYLVGGLISSLSYFAYYNYVDTSTNYYLIGASGAIYAIFVLAALYYPKQRMQLIFPPISMTLAVGVSVYILIDLMLFFTGARTGIAHLAHLGGALGGFILYFLWEKK